jgi:mRNA interferase MazF
MVFEQGDIIEVDFDPTRGHEPQKKRPALVVSNREFNLSTNLTIVCPITSANNRFFLHEPLPAEHDIRGAVVMEQVRAIDLETRGARKIATLDDADMSPILICLRSFF